MGWGRLIVHFGVRIYVRDTLVGVISDNCLHTMML